MNTTTDFFEHYDQLREQLAEALNPIHTCHNECQRPACVLRRENEALREALGLWVAWYKDSDAVGGPIHATRELLSKP